MLKLFLLFIVIVAALCFWRGGCRRRHTSHGPANSQTEAMVACAICAMHVPASEALTLAGRNYCCEAHRRLADD